MTTTHRFATTIAAAALTGLSLAACGKSTVEGAAGTKLSLYEPQAVVLHRGGTAKTDIKIARTALPGDVKIAFTNLPKGVALVESDLDARIAGNDGTFTLSASETADLVENSVANVTATGGDDIGVTKAISITVKENKP
jgi:ABC-type glycerol-3-phosphate transport system substrate-binding protein